MNALFGTLTTDGLEEAEDRLGGFRPHDTNIYGGTIKALYAGQSDGGARNVTLIAELDGREYRETIYVTNKKGENFFYAKDKDGKPTDKKVPLPGFTTVNDLCLIVTGKPLSEQTAEDKIVNVYDKEVGREIPKSVPMLTELVGTDIASFGVVRVLENKSERVGDEYVPTAETRDANFIEKVFHTETKMTVVEATNGADEATFWNSWLEKNEGVTRDKRTVKDGNGGQSGRPGASRTPPQAGGTAKPGKSLFGSK